MRTGAATVAAAATSYSAFCSVHSLTHTHTHCFLITHFNRETQLHLPPNRMSSIQNISPVQSGLLLLPNAAIPPSLPHLTTKKKSCFQLWFKTHFWYNSAKKKKLQYCSVLSMYSVGLLSMTYCWQFSFKSLLRKQHN